jgi:hypothetical protein
MNPADAESEAKRLGLGPLASEPDPNDGDPMREPFWTQWRCGGSRTAPTTPSAIGGTSIGSSSLFGSSGSGVSDRTVLSIRGRSNATLVRLQMVDANRDQADLMSAAEAIDALWLAIRSGSLEVTGIDEDSVSLFQRNNGMT